MNFQQKLFGKPVGARKFLRLINNVYGYDKLSNTRIYSLISIRTKFTRENIFFFLHLNYYELVWRALWMQKTSILSPRAFFLKLLVLPTTNTQMDCKLYAHSSYRLMHSANDGIFFYFDCIICTYIRMKSYIKIVPLMNSVS